MRRVLFNSGRMPMGNGFDCIGWASVAFRVGGASLHFRRSCSQKFYRCKLTAGIERRHVVVGEKSEWLHRLFEDTEAYAGAAWRPVIKTRAIR